MADTQSSLNPIRVGFKYFNHLMVFLWRLGLGQMINFWPAGVGRILVITHTGRKTGRRRRTPVNYAIIENDLYCTAGFGANSDWYKNILHHPGVEIWLPEGWWSGTAEDISGAPDRLIIMRQILLNSGFAAYAAGVNPRQTSDEQLGALTADYRLVRIKRNAACTGNGGPGEYAWVWPLTTFLLLPMVIFKRKR